MKEFDTTLFHKADIHKLNFLIGHSDFKDYRYYRVFKKEIMDRYIFGQILDLLSDNKQGWVVVTKYKNKIVGLISLVKLNWASEILGIEMSEIKHVIACEVYGNRNDIIREALFYIFEICSKVGIVHICCRTNTDDIPTVHCLEENGFRIVDTSVSFLFNKRRHKIPRIKSICNVRLFKDEDMEDLTEIVKGAFPYSRFYVDSKIPNELVDKFHIRWLKEYCKDSLVGRILVTERKDKISGFLAYKINKKMEELSGYKIAGQGLSAISDKNKGRGDYPTLVKASIQDVAEHYDFGEFDTQINNYEVIRVWQRFGFDFVKSKYTFHRWFDR